MSQVAAGLAALIATLSTAPLRTTHRDGRPIAWRSPAVTIHAPVRWRDVDVKGAARAAATRWNTVGCASVRLSIAGELRGRGTRIEFREKLWCRDGDPARGCYDPVASAMSTVTLGTGNRAHDILDVLVEINAVHYEWHWRGIPSRRSPVSRELEAALTHEFGHLLGLAHPCRGPGDDGDSALCDAEDAASGRTIMFPAQGDVGGRTLGPEDVRAVCEIYPAASGRR